MVTVEQHERALCERAVELGARAARPLSARRVVVDPRVTLKCRVPLCAGYGRNLMCPPFVPTAGGVRRHAAPVRARRRRAAGHPPDEPSDVAAAPDGQGIEGAAREPGLPGRPGREPERLRRRSWAPLEREALYLGYPFAAAFGGGECRLCEACVAAGTGPSTTEPCRKPFRARPAMEAVGIDVLATAAAAGLPVQMPAADDPVWTGLLLSGLTTKGTA